MGKRKTEGEVMGRSCR